MLTLVGAAMLLLNGRIASVTASAPRYWPKYGGERHVELLDGIWESSQLGTIDDPPMHYDSMDPTIDPSTITTPNITMIPSCVDNMPPGYLGYRGITFYRTTFDYDFTQSTARLVFQACSFYCRIWINNIEIGDHRSGGYVTFYLDIPQQDVNDGDDSTTNELFVLVDNRFNRTTAPVHTGGDFWHYGGIMRSVELHTGPPLPDNSQQSNKAQQQQQLVGETTAIVWWPWRLYVLPTTLSTVQLKLHVWTSSLTVDHVVNGTIIDDIQISFDDGPSSVYSGMLTIDKERNNLKNRDNGNKINSQVLVVDLGIVDVPNPRTWSTDNPQLHTVQVTINGASVIERFGLRIFGTDPKTGHITLNDEEILLVGWNHHTQWPETAASPTDDELDSDMVLLKLGGANFVRGAHYPQDPRWLDRLDENGMIMWCETLGPEVTVKDTTSSYFLQHQAQQVHEMLDSAFNHASIAIWAFFNEGPSNVIEACPAYDASANIIKERDPTRFVTWASNKPLQDKCYESATLIAINAYPAWYRTKAPKPFWNHIANGLKAGVIPEATNKPFIISETGAGGIYEWSDNATASIWTLAYQSKVIAEDVDTAIKNENISGISLWHFFDFKTNDSTENNTYCEYIPNVYPPICSYINASESDRFNYGRPGGLNHKGVIDYWRRFKPSFEIVAKKYNATKKNPKLIITSNDNLRSSIDQQPF